MNDDKYYTELIKRIKIIRKDRKKKSNEEKPFFQSFLKNIISWGM